MTTELISEMNRVELLALLAEARVVLDDFIEGRPEIEGYELAPDIDDESESWYVWFKLFEWEDAKPFGEGMNPLDAVLDGCQIYDDGVALAE